MVIYKVNKAYCILQFLANLSAHKLLTLSKVPIKNHE